ncbi:hypothetical protein [Frateuria sp. STR12]|uniref:hypothetical protein n=1 Tax=Frateuria hangzhouensis TaxID=2995589 RepID=UPI0022609632|nr:hypothetical protein [Frateuria sp. STR12]MCX7514733.1 hypothetical protein [Frateuria sp. STR12]
MAMKSIRWIPALVLACALPLAAQGADPGSAATRQVSTASAHAGMALGAANLKMAHAHLQHVINCLVGPSGQAFDADAENPCKGMGEGAIVDAKGDAARESQLQAALNEAQQGLHATTLADAQADAQKVLSSLKGQ